MMIEKGQPYYIKAKKKNYLIFSVVEFGVVAALVLIDIYAQARGSI